MNDGKAVLITGGAGFIGSHLAEKLVAEGVRVTALDDLSTGNLRNIRHMIGRPGFQFRLGSVLDQQLCDQMVADSDEVIHLAAAVGVKLIFERPMETIDRNVRGTEYILEAALRHGRKVFIASTSEVYGKEPAQNGSCFAETDDIILGPSMRWSYACSKALDEFLGRAYFRSKGLPMVIGRFFNTVGPRQSGAYGMVIPRFIEWALSGKPLQVYGDGLQVRSFTHVRDVIRAVCGLLCEPKAEGEVFNIGSTEAITILDLARRIITLTQSCSEITFLSYEQAYGNDFDDIRNRVPNVTKIGRLLGFQPELSLDEILTDTIASIRLDGK